MDSRILPHRTPSMSRLSRWSSVTGLPYVAFAASLLVLWGPAIRAETLTWDACIAQTTRYNAALRAAHDRLRAAESRTRSAAGAFLPQISAAASRNSYDYAGTNPPTDYNASVTATQNLFAGFRDEATLAQAEANAAATEATLRIAKAQASYDLKSAFAALRHARASLRLADDIIGRREENLKLVELRYEGGRENKGSYFLSRAAVGQARYERLQAGHALLVAQEQLARVLGRDEARDLDIVGEVPEASPPERLDLEKLLPQVPEYQQALAEERAAEEDVRIARSALLPTLNLSGTAARQGDEWLSGDRRNSAALTLTVPIFSGGKDYHATESAAATLDATRASRDHTARTVRTALQQGYTGYLQADRKREVDRDFLAAATARAEIARSKYNNGLLSFEDWDIIENDLIIRQKAVLTSSRDRVTAEAAWELAQGKGVIP